MAQVDNYGANLNYPNTTLTATDGAVTATFTAIATGSGIAASNNGIILTLSAGAKTPVYLNNQGIALSNSGQAAPTLISGSYPALVNATSTTVNYGQGAIVVLGLANLATVNGVANTPVGWNQSGTPTIVAIVGQVYNLDVNGNLLGAENNVGQNGGPGVIAFPDVPDLITPIGYFTVKNPVASSTATFTFGTTNWNATSIVTTAYQVATYPLRPLIGF